MKILHIIPNLKKGGAERMVTDIVRELAKRQGIEVRLVIFRNEIAYDIEDILHLIHCIPASIQLSLWRKNRVQITALQNFLEDFQPDIIHSHLFEAEMVSRSCFYPKTIWFSHGHDKMHQLQKFQIFSQPSKARITEAFERTYLLKRYIRNGGTTFISISKQTENYFKQNIQNHGHLLMLNPIDYNKFKQETIRKCITNPIKLINVGSFVTKKNHQLLIKIAKELNKQGFDFEVHFLGDGELFEVMRKLAANNEVGKICYFHGNVDNVEIYLSESDIYIHTARHEPFGLVIIEAMAAGLPVITLDGGATEI